MLRVGYNQKSWGFDKNNHDVKIHAIAQAYFLYIDSQPSYFITNTKSLDTNVNWMVTYVSESSIQGLVAHLWVVFIQVLY